MSNNQFQRLKILYRRALAIMDPSGAMRKEHDRIYIYHAKQGTPGQEAWKLACVEVPVPLEILEQARDVIKADLAARKRGEAGPVLVPALYQAESKPLMPMTGVDWIDWVYAHWRIPPTKMDPPGPGWIDMLEYYRKHPNHFRLKWEKEWERKRDKEESRKPSKMADPANDQDAELAATLKDLRNGAG